MQTPVSIQLQTTLLSIETQIIEVRDAQTAKTKGEIQDEMEDRKQRDKEKQSSPIYPWDIYFLGIICTEQPERLRNSHTSCCLFAGGNNQSMRVNKPISYQEIQRIRRIWETI